PPDADEKQGEGNRKPGATAERPLPDAARDGHQCVCGHARGEPRSSPEPGVQLIRNRPWWSRRSRCLCDNFEACSTSSSEALKQSSARCAPHRTVPATKSSSSSPTAPSASSASRPPSRYTDAGSSFTEGLSTRAGGDRRRRTGAGRGGNPESLIPNP